MHLRRFYEAQLDLLRRGDATALVAKHYHPGAVLVTPERVVKGRAALEALSRSYISTLGGFSVKPETHVEEENFCLVEAEINPGPYSRRVYDAFVIKSNRIVCHFAGVFR